MATHEPIAEISIPPLSAGLSCDGDTTAVPTATQPSIEDLLRGAIPGIPVSAILDAVAALVVVLGPSGQIIRSNRACERMTGYDAEAMRGRYFRDLFMGPDDPMRALEFLGHDFESYVMTADLGRRQISWSSAVLPGTESAACIIATGINVTERKRTEQAVLDVGAIVQRQIAQDLHDGLGQHLTGIAFMSKVLEQQLADSGTKEAIVARKIVKLVNEAISRTRALARGLLPVVADADGLVAALRQWATEVEDLFHIPCEVQCPEQVVIPDVRTATHLYHIAQEAVTNAIRHAKPSHLSITLSRANGTGVLIVEDNGVGVTTVPPRHEGLGLQIMRYRADIVGGSLELSRREPTGTAVCCRFPIQ